MLVSAGVIVRALFRAIMAKATAEGATLVHPDLGKYEVVPWVTPKPGTNVCNHLKVRKGDYAGAIKRAAHVFENTFRVVVSQFLDRFNFDLGTVKRSCVH